MEIASKTNKQTRAALGKQGEEFTQQWLKKNNYTILATNYRTKLGEIDIIARQKNVIAFIEVKLRSNDYFQLSQVVTPSKQKKIIACALDYSMRHNVSSCVLRFDIALLHCNDNGFSLEYIPNAFTQREGDVS
jgi:putative endonuclease